MSGSSVPRGTGSATAASTFDRTIDDVFLIQDEIARSITESLRVTLTRPATGSW